MAETSIVLLQERDETELEEGWSASRIEWGGDVLKFNPELTWKSIVLRVESDKLSLLPSRECSLESGLKMERRSDLDAVELPGREVVDERLVGDEFLVSELGLVCIVRMEL